MLSENSSENLSDYLSEKLSINCQIDCQFTKAFGGIEGKVTKIWTISFVCLFVCTDTPNALDLLKKLERSFILQNCNFQSNKSKLLSHAFRIPGLSI